MTREEAIDIIKCLAWHTRPDEEEIKQAIKALEQEPNIRNCFGCKYSKDNHNAGTEECHLCMWENQYTPTTKNDLGVDCVSRQEVDRLARIYLKEATDNHVAFYEHFLDLPSVTPQEPRWIPVSERLPEEREWIGTKRFGTTISDEVYVTLETSDGERFTKHLRFQNGGLSKIDQETMRMWYKEAVPIAWMPLPTKPYESQESEG